MTVTISKQFICDQSKKSFVNKQIQYQRHDVSFKQNGFFYQLVQCYVQFKTAQIQHFQQNVQMYKCTNAQRNFLYLIHV